MAPATLTHALCRCQEGRRQRKYPSSSSSLQSLQQGPGHEELQERTSTPLWQDGSVGQRCSCKPSVAAMVCCQILSQAGSRTSGPCMDWEATIQVKVKTAMIRFQENGKFMT